MQGQQQRLKCQAGDETLLCLTLGIKPLYRPSPRLPEHISQLTSLRDPCLLLSLHRWPSGVRRGSACAQPWQREAWPHTNVLQAVLALLLRCCLSTLANTWDTNNFLVLPFSGLKQTATSAETCLSSANLQALQVLYLAETYSARTFNVMWFVWWAISLQLAKHILSCIQLCSPVNIYWDS